MAETATPAAKPDAVTAAQTLVWVFFAAGFSTFAPYLYTSAFPPEGTAFGLDMLLGAALFNLVVAVLPFLAFHVGRRRWIARWLTLGVCTASALTIGAYLLVMVSDPFFYDNGDMHLSAVWAMAFVALPIAVGACLLTPAANRWFREAPPKV